MSQANNLGQIMVHNYSIGSEARRNLTKVVSKLVRLPIHTVRHLLT